MIEQMLRNFHHDDLDFERDVAIDETALEMEWLEHSKKYFSYCRASADANLASKQAYLAQKTKLAELLQIAEAACLRKGIKANVDNMNAWATSHPEYLDATEARNKAEYEAEMCAHAVSAMGHRKVALEELSGLDARSYFSRPIAPRNLTPEARQAWQEKKRLMTIEMKHDTSTSIRDRLNERRRDNLNGEGE